MDSSYNNLGGFGSGGAVSPAQVSAPISSGTDDIVLAPEKKSHKGVIVALVLAVLIVGGLFMALFLTPKSGEDDRVSNDAKVAFNRYANYFLYGEDSDKPLEGEYDENDIYKLDEMSTENTQTVTNYFKRADEFLSNFESLANKNTNNDFITTVREYRESFELVKGTFNEGYVSEEELINEVLNNDLEDVKTWIADKYVDLVKSSYENVKRYAETEINYYQLYAEYLWNLKTKGCFENEAMCDSGIDENIESQMMTYSREASESEISARHNLLEGCWDIERLMNE